MVFMIMRTVAQPGRAGTGWGGAPQTLPLSVYFRPIWLNRISPELDFLLEHANFYHPVFMNGWQAQNCALSQQVQVHVEAMCIVFVSADIFCSLPWLPDDVVILLILWSSKKAYNVCQDRLVAILHLMYFGELNLAHVISATTYPSFIVQTSWKRDESFCCLRDYFNRNFLGE